MNYKKLIEMYLGRVYSPDECGLVDHSDGNGVQIYFWNIADKPQPTIAELEALSLKVEKQSKKNEIKSRYADIMEKYVCAHVKRTLFETAEYQSVLTDMYTELEALNG